MPAAECAVCLSAFRSPTLVPSCGHTFCAACIEALPATTSRVSGARTAACPLCRTPFDKRTTLPNYALAAAIAAGGDEGAAAHAPSAPPMPAALLRSESTRATVPAAVAALRDLGFPPGLARIVADADGRVGLRLFVLDNSGSTSTYDGNKLTAEYGVLKMKPCTRWEEIKTLAIVQAQVALAVGVPAEFHLLNPISGRDGFAVEGDGFVRVCDQDSFNRLVALLSRTEPRGVTPLADCLSTIRRRLEAERASLRGKRVFLSLVTDGLPTALDDGRSTPRARDAMVRELRALATQHGVQLVVRLCTDDNSVVDFFDKLDQEAELPMDCLDDLRSEAKEVKKMGNGWLCYTPALHTVREGGTDLKLLDLLDERCLNVHETAALVELLLGVDPSTGADHPIPIDPVSDAGAYVQEAERRAAALGDYYDASRARLVPLVDAPSLRSRLAPSLATRLFRFLGAA